MQDDSVSESSSDAGLGSDHESETTTIGNVRPERTNQNFRFVESELYNIYFYLNV